MKAEEARVELRALAAEYQRLAVFAHEAKMRPRRKKDELGDAVAKEDAMGMMLALGLIVLIVVAGCFLCALLSHFEEYYPAAKVSISHPRRVRLFLTLIGLTTVGILTVLLLEFQQLVSS